MEFQTSDTTLINNAYAICKSVLTKSYSGFGINAGSTHFSDIWTRDSCFASWGALAINDHEIVKNFLTYSTLNLSKTGQVPLRIGEKYFLAKYVGLKGAYGPTYIEDKYISTPMDSNALLTILFCKYFNHSNDTQFAKRYFSLFKKIIDWYLLFESNSLVNEWHYAGWADSVKKKGHVLYTHTLIFHALNELSSIASHLNNTDNENELKSRAAIMKDTINHQFWNGTYYIDWIYKQHRQETFSVEGNLFAILFGLANDEQQQQIINYINTNNVISDYGLTAVHPKYKKSTIYGPFHLINLTDYHNGLIWFWLSCLAFVTLNRSNEDHLANKLIINMSTSIVTHGTMYEVYEKNGRPVNRLFYKSEKNFAWSAGLFVWAYNHMQSSR